MNAEQQINQWGQIVARAWQDDGFKKRLIGNPSAILKEQGLELPAGVQLRLVENTDQILYLTLPAKPREGQLSDAELAGIAGGWGNSWLRFRSLSTEDKLKDHQAYPSLSPSQKAAYGAGEGLPPT